MTKAEAMKQRKEEETLDFDKDVSINKYRLDEECLSHSGIFARYAELQADAKTRVSNAKDQLELVEAQRNLAIREELSKSGAKVTEAMINSYLVTDKAVIEAKEALRKAEDVYGKLSVGVQAFEHRKSELDNLTKLYCAGYYSMPSSSSETRKNINEQTSNAVRKNLNK